jgi:predicted PurR-regulated permease PerM
MVSNSPDPQFEQQPNSSGSPPWNWTTKLVVGLAIAAIATWLLVRFQAFLGPIISAFILAYLIYPIASFLHKKIKIPWRISVTIIYVILFLSLAGLATWGGIALADQIQNLIQFIENNIDQLPDLVTNLTSQTYQIGPFTFSPSGINWEDLSNQIVNTIQPIIGRIGSIASSFATGAASTVSWILLIYLTSYFLLAESEGISRSMVQIKIPGYQKDFVRLGDSLNRIWNGFFRGEIIVVIVSFFIYIISLGALGVQFFFGLAVIAAFGQLIPYIGAWITWITFGLVALLQSSTPFGLPPGIYMLIVLGVSMFFNTIIDNVIRTTVMAENLKVHPAMVLVGALIGVQLFGFIGIVIAAPVVASLALLLHYVINKLNDQNPWKDYELQKIRNKSKIVIFLQQSWEKFNTWIGQKYKQIRARFSKADSKSSTSDTDHATSVEEK